MMTTKAVLFGDARLEDLCNAVLESWPAAGFDRPDCCWVERGTNVCI